MNLAEEHSFHFLVCLKIVPKPEEIRVDPHTHWLDREGVRSEINPPDMNALEMALDLRDRYGGRVSVLSMGPPMVQPHLRLCLAMGADRVYLLSDPAFSGADTLATTYTLMKGIQEIGDVDLILCGEESSDGATGQVPPGLAEWLDLGEISQVHHLVIDRDNGTVRGHREILGGREILECELPAVISVKTAANEPRFLDYRRKPYAEDVGHVIVWGRDSLDVNPEFIGGSGSPTVVSGLKQAPTRDRRRELLQGNPDEIAGRLVEILACHHPDLEFPLNE